MSPIIVALDYPAQKQALALVDQLDPSKCRLKVGLEMYSAFGAPFVKDLMSKGFDVFLDLKFHDIPNTVARACHQVADLGVWMTNVHALGGLAMMQAAKAAIDQVESGTKLIAVTILTSHKEDDLDQIGVNSSIDDQVLRLARLAHQAKLDGVVCSSKEVAALKQQLPLGFEFTTPGIRPEWAHKNDQQRVLTPAQAIAAGSTYLVVGRPITAADSPMAALAQIQAELNEAR